MKRAPISAGIGLILVCGIAGTAAAQSKAGAQPVRRTVSAERGISSSEVHITPTHMLANSTSIDIAGDHWIARGFDLKTLIAQIYDIDIRRIDFSSDRSGDAKYDVTLTLPREVDEDVMQRMLETALERKFGMTITPESRAMDVYVLTAPNGPGAALHRHRAGGMKLAAQASPSRHRTMPSRLRSWGKLRWRLLRRDPASAGTLGEFWMFNHTRTRDDQDASQPYKTFPDRDYFQVRTTCTATIR